jgi:phage shock protein E
MRASFRFVCFGFALTGCAAARAPAPTPQEQISAPTQTITGQQARTLVQSGAKLVDVRSAEEFAQRHIGGAMNIPVADIAARAAELGEKTRPVVVYCRSGKRAARAAATLREAGFVKVENLGAMDNW